MAEVRLSAPVKLLDLDPRWFAIEEGGPRVGLTFLCPNCRVARLGVAFHHSAHAAMDDGYIRAKSPSTKHIWTLVGDEDFATLTLTPSVDASEGGHAHGFLTAGFFTQA